MKPFSKSKPFGTISGHDPSLPVGAMYEQNGMLYDHNGKYLSGEYKPGNAVDKVEDLEEQVKKLQQQLEAKAEGKPELDRPAIVAKLKELNVEFRGNDKTENLYDLLQAKIDEE